MKRITLPARCCTVSESDIAVSAAVAVKPSAMGPTEQQPVIHWHLQRCPYLTTIVAAIAKGA